MENDMQKIAIKMKTVEKLRHFFLDDASYGRVYADLHDLLQASEWLLEKMDQAQDETINLDKAEDFLISLDVHYIQHVAFHLKTLRKDLSIVLRQIDKARRK